MRQMTVVRSAALGILLGFSSLAFAAPGSGEKVVTINSVDAKGVGQSLGKIVFADSDDGLVITPNLKGLPPGEHGFHIHENPSCDPKEKDGKMAAAMAAGGHMDPTKSGKHMGPQGGGHTGDLPKLLVDSNGAANEIMRVKGLKVKDLENRSVMIHAGGDNYSDTPEPLGGGGPRIACGVIK
jgi:Cu-Zn family superoxide dismutase